jgi:PAS domain S-box-containing protein
MNFGATSPTPELDGLLVRSPIAMLLADDQRRYVDVNEAACALLGLRRAELLEAGVDGLTPAALRGRVPALWDRFLEQGTMQGVYELTDASGRVIRINYVAIARVLPGLHLSCLLTARSPDSAGALSRRETRRGDPRGARTDEQRDRPHTLALPGHRRNPLPQRCQTTERPQPSSRHRPRPNPRGDRPASRQRGISEKARTWPQA